MRSHGGRRPWRPSRRGCYSRPVLETLAKGFRSARQRLTGVAELTDGVIDEALRDVRLSLLEGDVEFRVVKRFLDRVRESARGKQVELRAKSAEYGTRTITPEQAFVAICKDELIKMMGPVETELKWAKKGPTGIMMCGLQGSGKTTTVGKLARYLEKNQEKADARRGRYLPARRRRAAQDARSPAPDAGLLGRARSGRDLSRGESGGRRADLRRRHLRYRRPARDRRAADAGARGYRQGGRRPTSSWSSTR